MLLYTLLHHMAMLTIARVSTEQQDHQHDQEPKTYKGTRKQDSRDNSSEGRSRWDKMF
jgi:hypothetical protein